MSDYTVELRPHQPWLLAEATPEEGEDSAAAFKRELKAHLEKQAEGVRVATLPDTGEQAGDQVCHSAWLHSLRTLSKGDVGVWADLAGLCRGGADQALAAQDDAAAPPRRGARGGRLQDLPGRGD